MRSDLENTELREKLDTLEKTLIKGRQLGTQETGFEVECRLRDYNWYDKRTKLDKVNHICRGSSGGEELE